jgi:hypothetical protein
LEAFVPDAIPEGFAKGIDVLASFMDEDEVKVRKGTQFSSAISANGNEGHRSVACFQVLHLLA